MTEFKANKKYTLNSNLRLLENKAKIGDIVIFENGDKWRRIDGRKNDGDIWELIR